MTTAEKIKALIDQQQAKGYAKYGTTVDDANLTKLEWLRHAQEEICDLLIYLQKIMDAIDEEGE